MPWLDADGQPVSDPEALKTLGAPAAQGGQGSWVDASGAPVTDPSLLSSLAAPPKPFKLLPYSEDAQGKVSLDWNAGLPGAISRAFMAPYDAMTGKFDPMSEEGQSRAREMATFISPPSAALAAGERIIPGVATAYKRPIPTAQGLKDTASAQYDAVRATGAEYPGQSVGTTADALAQDLQSKGFVDATAPKTLAVLNQLRNPPNGAVVTISSLDAARRTLGKITGDSVDQEAARRAIQGIDEFIQRGASAPPVAGAPAAPGGSPANGAGLGGLAQDAAQQEAARLIKDARGNSAAAFRSDRITDAETAAELRAAAANSGRNIGNATRQRLASILLSDEASRGFNPLELAAIRSVVEGTGSSNTLRYVSNLLGGGGGVGQSVMAGVGAGIGGTIAGPGGAAVGATAAPLVGSGTRSAYNALVGRQVNKLDELIRQRSPLYQQTPGQLVSPEKRAFLARLGLLSGEQANEPVPLDLFSRP